MHLMRLMHVTHRLRTAVAVLILGALCAACNVDITIDVKMSADGSGTITVTATADSDVVTQAPNLVADMHLDDIKAAGWSVQGPAKTPSGGLQIVLTHPFATPKQATAILADLNGPSGPLKSITLTRSKKGDTTTYSLGGTLQIVGGLDAFSDADLFAALGATPYAAQAAASPSPDQAVTVKFRAKLPGTVKKSTATSGSASSPTGLAWPVPLSGSIVDVTTQSTQHDAKNIWASPLARGAKIVFSVWIVASVCFIAFVIFARRRRRHIRALR
jgi:hypothetical protein